MALRQQKRQTNGGFAKPSNNLSLSRKSLSEKS